MRKASFLEITEETGAREATLGRADVVVECCEGHGMGSFGCNETTCLLRWPGVVERWAQVVHRTSADAWRAEEGISEIGLWQDLMCVMRADFLA